MQVSVVMVKPLGTGRPRRVISATFAPLPPSRSRISRPPSEKSYTRLVITPVLTARLPTSVTRSKSATRASTPAASRTSP